MAAVRLPSRNAGGRPAVLDRASSPGRRPRPPAPERRLTEPEFRALLDHGTAEDMADVLLTLTEPARRVPVDPLDRGASIRDRRAYEIGRAHV